VKGVGLVYPTQAGGRQMGGCVGGTKAKVIVGFEKGAKANSILELKKELKGDPLEQNGKVDPNNRRGIMNFGGVDGGSKCEGLGKRWVVIRETY